MGLKLTSMLVDEEDYTTLKNRGYSISALCRKLMRSYVKGLKVEEENANN